MSKIKYFPLALLLSLSSPVLAEEDICKVIGDSAETVMTLRQQNVPMSHLKEVVSKQPNPDVRLIYDELIDTAYAQMYFEGYKDLTFNSIAKFRNDWELVCYNSKKKEKAK